LDIWPIELFNEITSAPNKWVQGTRHKVSGPLTPNVGHQR